MTVIEVLEKYQKQLDPEGIEVGVSRQALDELIELYKAADKEIATKDAELARLREALEKIENPMRYLQEYAAETGTSIDEIAAKQLSNDADWLKGIAWEALHNDS